MIARVLGAAVCASALAISGFEAKASSMEEMAATIRALQARIETLEGRSRRERPAPISVSRRFVSKDAPPALLPSPRVVPNAFEGAYATVLGGYNFGTDRQVPSSFFFLQDTRLSSVSNGRAGISVGYNRVIDDLLFGVEGRMRADFGQTAQNGSSFNSSFTTFPFYVGTDIRPITTYPDFLLSNAETSRQTLSRQFGGDLAARFGITLNDWLLYGRLGAGMEALRVERTVDQTGVVTCVNPIVSSTDTGFGFFNNSVVGCGSQRTDGVTRTVNTFASPYVVVGMGVERNFGPIFARLEGNLHLNLPPAIASGSSSGVSYSPEVLGAVGYRF